MTLLAHELEVALEVIERCGAIALAIQAGGYDTMQTAEKADDQGPVTRADLAVEAALTKTLREHFPDDAILAEESAARSDWRTRERVWMIDPVDGTKDFAGGDPSWAIHVALTIAGRPSLGIVCEPGHGRTCWAIDTRTQRRAWCRSKQEDAVALHGLGRAKAHHRLVTSKSHRSERLDAIMSELGISDTQTLRIPSTGVKIGMVARGEAEIYAHPTLGTKLWDTGAPEVILHAAGGQLTDMYGEPLRYLGAGVDNARGLLATARGVDHGQIVERLRPLVDRWFG